jgi:hypothetical protein
MAEAATSKETLAIVPSAAFAACDFEAPLKDEGNTDTLAFSVAYMQAASAAKAAEHYSDEQVYLLLNALCSIHLNPDDRGSIWSPGFSYDGRRSMLPSDIRGEQSDVLEGLLDAVKHPALRARLADVVWSNDRRKAHAAAVAVEAYCICAEGLLSGELSAQYETDSKATFAALKSAHRAIQIAYATNKKGHLPDRVRDVILRLYEQAIGDEAYVVFTRLAKIAEYYEIMKRDAIASNAEELASGAAGKYPMAVKLVWDLAAHFYRRVGNNDASRRCELEAVEQLLLMRNEVQQAGAKASWVMQALQALRHIKGTEQKEEELEQELRRLQRASVKEMGAIPIELDVRAERDRVLDFFEALRLSDALKNFALLEKSPAMEDLREQALQMREHSPVVSMFGATHIDDEGKTIAKTSGASGHGEPQEDWFRRMIAEAESIRRVHAVAAAIEPVRVHISQKFSLEERHFFPIVGYSPFVPPLQQPLYALGFARFFQGDMRSAAHLILPQLEPSLRHILKVHGYDPAKRFDDSTEEDSSLGRILERHRPDLERILSPAVLDEIERLFHLKPGPALRHDVAHGQLSAGQCFTPDVTYAIWFMYRVCCLFAIKVWNEFVAPAISQEEPGR